MAPKPRAGQKGLPPRPEQATVKSCRPLAQGGWEVELEEGAKLRVDDRAAWGLGAGDRLAAERLAALWEAALARQAEEAALRLMSRREHGRKELERKLKAKLGGWPGLAGLLDSLEERGLLNEERFAAMLIRERMERGLQGPRRVAWELAQRGMAAQKAETAVADAAWQPGWMRAAARRAAQEWARAARKNPAAEGYVLRGMVRDKLFAQGFDEAAIGRALEGLGQKQEEPVEEEAAAEESPAE